PGIPPESLDDIFRRFYSERPADEDFGKHSGLGLAIAAAVAEAHDGRIEVRNRDSGGACFTVHIPAAA
ncbi:MAG: histidine kinase, partial [Alphaproteobacteria bacterium]|nr:histidine kinase [Alphaproteobacteria bacterium]